MQTEEIWRLTVEAISPLISKDQSIHLEACHLSKEDDKWVVSAPSQYSYQPLTELKDIVALSLKKHGVFGKIKFCIAPQDGLFDKFSKKDEKSSRPYENRLNPQYRFDNFVIGDSNDLAFHTVKFLSTAEEKERSKFNPLLIYGGTGLGKSHLMHAAGHAIYEAGYRKIICIDANEFVDDYIKTLNDRKMEEFKEHYHNADALLIDDVQFLKDKEKSQEVFFHIFNRLHARSKPIILTSDKLPSEIDGLESRLISRFLSGVSQEVRPPEFETRVAILKNKAEQLEINLPDEVAKFIANNVVSNVRVLGGALSNVYTKSGFGKLPITTLLAREALKDLINAQEKKLTMDNIRKVVSNYYQVSLDDLDGKSRKKEIIMPRQIAMHLIKSLTHHSLAEIGRAFGGRDHTTVISSCNKIDELLKNDQTVKDIYQTLEITITG